MGLKDINKKFLPLKAHYFLWNAGTAPIVPFMPTYAKQLGFSSTVVGTIYTVLPISGLLAKPLVGAIADRFHKQKIFFLLFQLLTILAFFSIKFIPSIPQSSSVEFHCNNGASNFHHCEANGDTIQQCIVEEIQNSANNATIDCHLNCAMTPTLWNIVCNNWNESTYCPNDKTVNFLNFNTIVKTSQLEVIKACLYFNIQHGVFPDGSYAPLYCPHLNNSEPYFNTTCNVVCDSIPVTELLTTPNIPNEEVSGLYQFWLLYLFLIASWVGMAVVVSVGDAICFEMLEDKPHLYGNQRLWGAVGWGLFSIIAGLLVDFFSQGQSAKDYSVVFFMMAVIIFFDMFVSTKLEHRQTKLSGNILRDVSKLFKSLRIVIFYLWCAAVGLCTALTWNFLFWYLELLAAAQPGCGHMTSMKTLQGLVMGIQCFGGELPFFFLSGWILKKIGHVKAMSLVLFVFAVRFFLYSILTNPWWVLPIELCNGMTFGIFYATMASYASLVAPPGTEATMQGLVSAIFEGIGVSIGSLIGGILFDTVGGSETFRIYAIGALLLGLAHFIVQYVLEKRRGKDSVAMEDNNSNLNNENNNLKNEQSADNDFDEIDIKQH